MATIKTIAIVGATGRMGSGIARRLRGKYRLLLMARDVKKLVDLQTELARPTDPDIYALSCAREAAWEADIIIIATPPEEELQVAEKIREVAIGKIVVSISHPEMSASSMSPEVPSAAEELQRRLPHSQVIKTFSTTFADSVIAVKDGKVVDAFVAGNNSDAVDIVSEVVTDAGLSPVPIVDLTMSRILERVQLTLVRLTSSRPQASYSHGRPVRRPGGVEARS